MKKPVIVEKYADGQHSHWELVDSDTGDILWTESSEERDKALPVWLSSKVRLEAKALYNSHKSVNDRKRVDAVLLIKRTAKAAGYEIPLNKAMDILQRHCL